MTITRLRRLADPAAFMPFTLHLADGRTLAVKHPEMIMFYENEQTCAVFRSDETVHVLDPRLVIDAEVGLRE